MAEMTPKDKYILLLEKKGARVTYTDPYIPSLRLNGHEMFSVKFEESVTAADCVVIVTDHKALDKKFLVDNAKLIVDTRNALKSYNSSKVVRL